MAQFRINVDAELKKLEVSIFGSISAEDSELYFELYNKMKETIDSASFVIDLNCFELDVSDSLTLPILEDWFVRFREDKFKFVIFRVTDPVLEMQLERLARRTDLTNYRIIMEEKHEPV